MIKVFISKKLKVQYIPILYPNLGVADTARTPFVSNALHYIKNKIVEIVDKPENADYICVPHDWSYVKKQPEYFNEYLEISRTYKKSLIIFATGDSPSIINTPEVIIFRTSQYSDIFKSNEIIIPGYVEDLLYGKKLKIREKREKPSIGFCGWASYNSKSRIIKSWIKNIRYDVLSILMFNLKWKTRKQGVFFRKKALDILSKTQQVKTNFIIRSSYSGHVSSVEVPIEQARKEYIENMENSDYILSPKGDGNYSLRFYEALSLGRIPIFIDTNCVLPLEYKIQYREFCMFLDWKDIKNIGNEISIFNNNLSNEKFKEMQRNARYVFEKYLRIDKFFEFTFSHLEEILENNKRKDK